MLIRVTVDNFLSFNTETELVMVSSSKIQKQNHHKLKIKGSSLLKYAVIYGANASGKSNLIEVFQFMQFCIKKMIPTNSTQLFCKNDKENSKRESLFELQFTINDQVYAYGFKLLLQERKITAEWLYELSSSENQKILFEREKGQKPVFGKNLFFTPFDREKIKIYLDDFDENSNMLFLTFMNKEKKYHSNSEIIFFKKIYDWITNEISICRPQTNLTSFEYYYDETSLININKIIQTFDTGITEVILEDYSLEKLKERIDPIILADLVRKLEEISKKIENHELDKEVQITMRVNRCLINIKIDKTGELAIKTISFKHGKSFYQFDFEEESDGTRRIFDLLDILLTKSEDKVYIIDEFERSLHPKLTARFIKIFDAIHKNKNVQLIFTTHESSIMDQELFRRDEIWFVERDNNNNSTVFSLDKFKERYDKKLSKAYLEGRYGAIPIFSTFKFEEDDVCPQ